MKGLERYQFEVKQLDMKIGLATHSKNVKYLMELAKEDNVLVQERVVYNINTPDIVRYMYAKEGNTYIKNAIISFYLANKEKLTHAVRPVLVTLRECEDIRISFEAEKLLKEMNC